MKRRGFIAGLGSAAVWPLLVRAQQQRPTIGWLDVRPGRPLPEYSDGFRRGLAEVGLSEGRDVTIEYHTTDGHPERLLELAADLVRRRPAVIVAATGTSAFAAKAATRDIQIIFITGTDPVEFGLVASLNRPGGNLTGIVGLAGKIAEKRLELLHKALPAAEAIAFFVGPADVPLSQEETRSMEPAARTLGLRLLIFNITTDTEIAPIFTALVEHQVSAVVAGGGAIVAAERDQILSNAAHFALPTMFYNSHEARQGALLSYGPDLIETARQMGAYTVRILKGEKPADLPVVQPTKFEFVINLKTAKALGLNLPPTLLAIADEVIE